MSSYRHVSVVVSIFIALGLVVAGCAPTASSAKPSGTIALEGGKSAVNNLKIVLNLSRSAHVPEMRVVDGADPTNDAWRPFSYSLPWDLPDTGQGTRIVSAQFRDESGNESEVVTLSLVFDTVPPVIVVTSPAPGGLIDVSHGELAVASGSADDPASGVSSIDVVAPDGSTTPATLGSDSESWTTPIAAPTSGKFTYNFRATDGAGNTGTTPVSLDIKAMPPTLGTVVRPSTWELTSEQRAVLSSVSATKVVISGDVRPASVAKTALISAAVPGIAEDGLLRSIASVTFDSEADETLITTSDASLADAFAQFSISAPTVGLSQAARLPAVVSDACSSFGTSKAVRFETAQSRSLSAEGGPADVASVAIKAETKTVVYADLDLAFKMGFVPKVTGSLNAGAMVCGTFGVSSGASFSKTFGFGSVYLPFVWFIGPVPIRIRLEGGLSVDAQVSGPKASVTSHVGFETEFPIGGSPRFSFPRGLTGQAESWSGGSVSLAASVGLVLNAADTIETKLVNLKAGPEFTYDANERKAEVCAKITPSFSPSLELKIPLTSKKMVVFSAEFKPNPLVGPCATIWRSATPGPTTTTTTTPTQASLTGNIARESNGNAWYIDKRNWRHWIPDGGTYECLVAQGKRVVAASWESDLKGLGDDAVEAKCVRAKSGDIIKTNDGDSYLVEPNFSRRWIADGGTFMCLAANGHAVVDAVPRYFIEDMAKAADYSWSCWNATAAKGKVVRADDGSSWYVDLRGGRHWIPDGGTYQCLVAQKGDYGNVIPKAWVNPLTQYENAQCVQANPGNIIKTNDGDSYLLESSTSRRPISDGGTYMCLWSEGRAVVGGVPRYYIDDLRQSSNIGGQQCIVRGPGGDAHFINNAGQREWIPDSPTYDCEVGRGVPARSVSQAFIDGTSPTGWHYCLNQSLFQGKVLTHSDGDSSYVHPDNTRTWIPDTATYSCRMNQGKQVVQTRWREYVNSFRNTGWDYCFDINVFKGKIVTHTAGDHHYVGYDGIRHWIPNNTVYQCLKSRGVAEVTTQWREYITAMTETTWAACP